MNKEKLIPVIQAFVVALLAYMLNKSLGFFPDINTSFSQFHYSLETLYVVFFVFTAIILIALQLVKDKNLDYVGMAFLLITSVKMGLSFFIVRPVLLNDNSNRVEKINFFVIFILFLTIETIITIRLLNKGNGLDKQNVNSIKK